MLQKVNHLLITSALSIIGGCVRGKTFWQRFSSAADHQHQSKKNTGSSFKQSSIT
jgi:hypothetical protein